MTATAGPDHPEPPADDSHNEPPSEPHKDYRHNEPDDDPARATTQTRRQSGHRDGGRLASRHPHPTPTPPRSDPADKPSVPTGIDAVYGMATPGTRRD